MPILRPKQSADKPAAIVAAAAEIRLKGTGYQTFRTGDTRWQAEAWRLYDVIGELRYAANYVGNSVSRARLYLARLDETGKPGEEVEDADLSALAESMFGGPAAKAEALRVLGIHLTIPGEAYIVAEGAASDRTPESWYVVSTSELTREGDSYAVTRSGASGGRVILNLGTEDSPGTDLLIRVWTPHARRYDHADSPTRPALPTLRKLEGLDKYDFATIDSRLAGAGIMFLPQGFSFPRASPDEPDGVAGFAAKLGQTMATAIQDPSSAAARVPIIVEVPPGEAPPTHLDLATAVAEAIDGKIDKTIRRLALEMDIPPEIMLGMSDVNHWTSWQISEESLKVHIEPILTRICDALTIGYIHPALEVLGYNPDEYTLWYDVSALTVRPNRFADTMTAYQAGVVSADAVVAAGNWDDDDLPGDDERQRRLAADLLKASPDGIWSGYLMRYLGLDPDTPTTTPTAPADAPAIDATPAPAPQDRDIPQRSDTDNPPGEAALVAADLLVRNALAKCGGRLKPRQRSRVADVPLEAIHQHIRPTPERARSILDAAKPWTSVPDVARRVGLDPVHMTACLDAYAHALLTLGAPHDPALLPEALRRPVQLPAVPGG